MKAKKNTIFLLVVRRAFASTSMRVFLELCCAAWFILFYIFPSLFPVHFPFSWETRDLSLEEYTVRVNEEPNFMKKKNEECDEWECCARRETFGPHQQALYLSNTCVCVFFVVKRDNPGFNLS